MGDLIHGPWWPQRTEQQVEEIELPITFPAGLIKIEDSPPCQLHAPIPADGFADGARVQDTVTGHCGTVRGRFWGGTGIEIGRPLKYAVEWDDPRMIEAVVACRLVPAPERATASPRHIRDLIGRRLRRIAWPPRAPDPDPPPPPRAA